MCTENVIQSLNKEGETCHIKEYTRKKFGNILISLVYVA